jgi:hypothetical protein
MTRLLALSLTALAVAVAVAGATPAAASASTKNCKTRSEQKVIIVTKVSCKRGKKVLRRFFAGHQHPFGFTCKQEQYEGGATTRCTKGQKIVEMQLAD